MDPCSANPPPRGRRLPSWLKVPLPAGENYTRLKTLVREHSLHTVCESARCPNQGECWNAGTLTVMIGGGTCSRACRFCDVPTGRLSPLDPGEPRQVAAMLARLPLRYVVITSVDRDDLPDGGARHWAETIRRVRASCPGTQVEALIPDFRGEARWVQTVCETEPHVLAHNVETVASLQSRVRPQSSYRWSLDTLSHAKKAGRVTKSSLMLGLGEKKEEVLQTLRDLAAAGVSVVSLGQYLRPSHRHLEVAEFVSPETFAEYGEIGRSLGFDHVEAGPLVRSSYHADRQARAAGVGPGD